jgi:hypothetical protein
MGFWSKVGGTGKKAAMAPVNHAKKLMGIDQARENLGWMAGLARGLLPSSVKLGRVETFEHAMARQDVTSEDLSRIFTNHVLRFWICAIMLLTGLAIGLNYMLAGSLISILPVIGFSAVCLSQMFAGSFRAYEIACRRFCDVGEWLSKPEVWVPLSFSIPDASAPKKTGAGLVVAPVKPTSKPPQKKV